MKRGIEHWKAKGLDFSRMFYMPKMPPQVAVYHCEKQDHGLEKALDLRLIELAQPALERRRARHHRDADSQHQPHRRHHAFGRGRQPLRPRGLARRHHPRAPGGIGRAELRRLPGQRRHPGFDRRDQRLLRQGAVRRTHQRAAEPEVPRRAHREHDHRQRRPVRGDRRGGLLPRRGGRALRRTQLRRATRWWRAWATTAAST